MTPPSTDPPPVTRPPGGSRVVSTERELADALAAPTLGAVAVAPDAGTGEPLRVIAPVGRTLFVAGHSRVQLGGGSWIEVHADGHAHIEAWDGRIHATGRARFLARGHTQVYATDNTTGTAIDAARVVALGESEVTAEGAAVIRAGDRAQVIAGGAVYVEATGHARVHTGPHVIVRRYSAECLVTGPGTVFDGTGLHLPALPVLTMQPPAPA